MDRWGWRALVAGALLWAGRFLIVWTPSYALWCRATQQGWQGVPSEAGFPADWTFDLLMLSGVLFGAALPLILLPIGSAARCTIDGPWLRLDTVLGTRGVRLDRARASAWFVPGRGVSTTMTSLRHGVRWCIVAQSETWSSSPVSELLPDPGQNLWSLVKGIALILATACCALLAGGLATEVGGFIG